ncbi:MAG: uncharacterized protein KVP18_000013 [Porospora cf. gigantea A]|uniref:uncharacterized protein n=1 Tax=Porospora cf. gigantea A TaxID=2853593 RepID=UPI00355991D5|nr:MAG: hypothetical protein KVP18_000013 [Porospora cf. gigantea A]
MQFQLDAYTAFAEFVLKTGICCTNLPSRPTSSPSPYSRLERSLWTYTRERRLGKVFRRSVADVLYVKLKWDHLRIEPTSKIKLLHEQAPNYQWKDSYQFEYSVEDINTLIDKTLQLEVWIGRPAAKDEMVGFVCINLLTVATGPLSHVLSLLTPQSDAAADHRSAASGDQQLASYNPRASSDRCIVGKISCQIRMSQICSLIAQPVEILCHIHESINNPLKEAGEDEEVTSMVDDQGIDVYHWLLKIDAPGHDCQTKCSSWTNLSSRPHWNGVHLLADAPSDHVYANVDNPLVVNWEHLASQLDKTESRRVLDESDTDASLAASSDGSKEWARLAMNTRFQGLTQDVTEAEVPPLIARVTSISDHVAIHINPDETRTLLEAACRGGELARNLIDEAVLPTFQLPATTAEQLRNLQLHIRVFAQRLGMEQPVFIGETWLPFCKIYDADNVELAHQNYLEGFFVEKLSLNGRNIGDVEGVVIFQNNPSVRQMCAGVHTDTGFARISPPILGSEFNEISFYVDKKSGCPKAIVRLAELHRQLLDTLFKRAQHGTNEAWTTKFLNQAVKSPEFRWHHRRRSFMALGEQMVALDELKRSKGDLKHDDLQKICEDVLSVLRQTHVSPGVKCTFLYSQTAALVIGQTVLLNLANHTLMYLEHVPWQLRSLYLSILYNCMKRGELDVGNVLVPTNDVWLAHFPPHSGASIGNALRKVQDGSKSASNADRVRATSCSGNRTARSVFSRVFRRKRMSTLEDLVVQNNNFKHLDASCERIESIVDTLDPDELEELSVFHKRMVNAKQMYLLFKKTLYFSLHSLGDHARLYEEHSKYLFNFLAFCFFRLPMFQKRVLKLLCTEELLDVEIPEWRGTEFGISKDDILQCITWKNNPRAAELQVLCDWSVFHQSLHMYFGEEMLAEAMANADIQKPDNGWKSIYSQNNHLFYAFVESWCKYVSLTTPMVQKDSREAAVWHLLPGYPIFVKHVLIDLKSVPVASLPDTMLNCTGAMLANPRLLVVFIKILFLRARVHNVAEVFAIWNYADYWLQVISLRGMGFPRTFDYGFFLKGIRLLLESDLSQNVAKTMWFLYKNIRIFDPQFIRMLVNDFILGTYAPLLCCNWSKLVRQTWIWILLYDIHCE